MRRDRRRVQCRRVGVLMVLAAGLFAAVAGPSSADVTSLRGSAFGASGSVSLFGGPPQVFAAIPTVSLPATGGDVSDSEPTVTFQAGPAVLLESGLAEVSSQGTTGAGGSVTSMASLTGVADGPGPFLYQEVASSCTANESGVTAATTITGGVVQTATDANTGNPTATFDVPVNPTPNLEVTGTLNHIGDSFRIVFNEQIPNADGSLTVNAAHMFLLGPTAVGEVFFAQSVCGVTATQTTTTQGVTTTQPPGATTTTQPPGVTTTTPPPGVTTTTQPPGATTTTRPGGTTTTTRVGGTTTTTAAAGATTTAPPTPGPGAPPSPHGQSLVRTGSTFESLAVLALLSLVLGALVLIGLSRQMASAGSGVWSAPWATRVRRPAVRRRRRRSWNRRARS